MTPSKRTSNTLSVELPRRRFWQDAHSEVESKPLLRNGPSTCFPIECSAGPLAFTERIFPRASRLGRTASRGTRSFQVNRTVFPGFSLRSWRPLKGIGFYLVDYRPHPEPDGAEGHAPRPMHPRHMIVDRSFLPERVRFQVQCS